jgi:hypothetical protein
MTKLTVHGADTVKITEQISVSFGATDIENLSEAEIPKIL